MLDMGFVRDVRRILVALPPPPQSLLFSATMPRDVARLAGDFLRDPVRVAVMPQATPVERIRQSVFHVSSGDKSESRLSQNPSSKRMQIFSNSGLFLSAFGVTWRFWAENAASMQPAIQHATVIVSDAAIRSCDWPAGRAAGAPCCPCRNAHAPRRSRSGRTARRTSGPYPGVARAPDRGPPPGSP